jgi:hypothetical protein
MEKYNGQKLNKHAIHLEIRKSLDAQVAIKKMGPQSWPYSEEYKETYRLASSYRMTVLCNLLALARGKPLSHMTTIWKKFGLYGMGAGYGDKEHKLTEVDIVKFVGEEWKKFLYVEEVVLETAAMLA